MATRGNKKILLVESQETKVTEKFPQKLLFIGGQNPGTGDPSSLVEVYHVTGGNPCDVKIPPLPGKRLDASLVAKDGEFYVIGGFDGVKSCDSTFKFVPDEMKWVELSHMNIARNGHRSCVLGNHIIIVGGVGNDMKRTASIEAYDIVKDIWINLPDLPQGPLTDAACVAHNGELIISGGIGGTNIPMNIVVGYNLESQRWRRLPDMKCRRSQHSMLSVKGELFILGDAVTKAIEHYDEQNNRFTVIGELPVPKCNAAAVVHGDTIILPGGWTSNDPVVTFNVQTHETTTSQITRNCLSPHVAIYTPKVLSLWILSRSAIRSRLTDSTTEGNTLTDKIQQLPLPRIIKEAI